MYFSMKTLIGAPNFQSSPATMKNRSPREMIELMTGFCDDMERLETERLVKLMTLGSKIAGLIDKTSGALALGKRK